MTLGGIAAAIGLVIDDAIVVVEAIYAKVAAGPRPAARRSQAAIGEICRPLVGSTLTPVVVFIPLAFLDGIAGVFFRALALTMVVSLLTSLVLAVDARRRRSPRGSSATATPGTGHDARRSEGGFLLRRVHRGSTRSRCGGALRVPLADAAGCLRRAARPASGSTAQLESDFLPAMDEGGFVIDYYRAAGHQPDGDEPPAAAGRGRSSARRPRSRATPAARARGWRWPSPSRTPAIFSSS